MAKSMAKELTYLHPDEVARLLKVITNLRDKAMFTVGYYCGLRASEYGLLELRDLRLKDNRIFVHRLKHSISNEHVLSPAERKALQAWMKERVKPVWVARGKWKDKELLFPNTKGGPIKRSGIFYLFRRYAALAKLPADKRHPHVLKHSIGTALLDQGLDIMDVKDWLGHRRVESTLEYAKVTNRKREEAARKFYNQER